MANCPQPHQLQVHTQHGRYEGGGKSLQPQRGPTAGQILEIITLLPVGGTLLCLAGLTLVGSLIGLAVTTLLFIICSPVLVPAILLLGLAVTGFLSSGAFGLTGLSSLSWVFNYFRQKTGIPDRVPAVGLREEAHAGGDRAGRPENEGGWSNHLEQSPGSWWWKRRWQIVDQTWLEIIM